MRPELPVGLLPVALNCPFRHFSGSFRLSIIRQTRRLHNHSFFFQTSTAAPFSACAVTPASRIVGFVAPAPAKTHKTGKPPTYPFVAAAVFSPSQHGLFRHRLLTASRDSCSSLVRRHRPASAVCRRVCCLKRLRGQHVSVSLCLYYGDVSFPLGLLWRRNNYTGVFSFSAGCAVVVREIS